ncbi:AAA domain (Cdc48 subfamily) protein [Aspergillus niger]|uniref:AAA domain (Cdc48 subfamily) protein n=1 Tax=Aspergillus niger TaxID=5061 RepID=A0A505ISU5_ASPNG|nr:AAA domain (Cdc48 subfamily) protein [Aspergillus niger]
MTTITPALNLTHLFTSLPQKQWTLLRVLKSANPHDINGNLHGTASFTPLDTTTAQPQSPPQRQLLYTETGTLPAHIGHNLQWKKSYIWRLSTPSTSTVKDDLSVWFVKVGDEKDDEYVSAPVPPAAGGETVVVTARGNHLCINDMYRTAYAFRVLKGDGIGEVVSWASRHVVKGPKKDQDIVNYYTLRDAV